MERGGMAAAKRPEVGVGMQGASWTPRRIAFHASSTYSIAPAMEPLNDPVIGNGSGGGLATGAAAGGGSGAGGNHPANKFSKQNAQNSQRLPSSMPLQWPTAQKIGAGLSNLGNTCFLNSVLQCLTYTPPLAGYLQSGQHKLSCRVAGFCAFCALQEHVSQALTSAGRVVAPNKLAKNLRSISRSFRMCRQEDAHEYMRYLLEALHKCCIPPELATSSSTNSKPSQDKSLVYKIFGGRLRSQVKCSVCSHCSNTYDPFLDLSLDIVRSDSLTKALTRFTAVDTLDGENKYRCAHCKKKVRAQKQFTIETVPNILTIQFKRFSGTVGGKIDKKVDFGTTLDMKPFCSSQESSLKYRLYGVLVHSGWSTHSGHYYCFVRTSSDIWHVLDDSRVRQVSERTVLDQKAYMLFYVREVRKESVPPGQVFPKVKPSPAPAPVPAVIPAPRDIKVVSWPSNEQSPEPKTNIAAERSKTPIHPIEVVSLEVVMPVPALVVVEPPRTAAESSSGGPEAPTSELPPLETRDEVKAHGKKSGQDETCCTTSGGEDEADWDDHYKSGMNIAMVSSQNMLKLLRAMPRTRRYFMARAMQRANRGLAAQNGHVGTLDSLSVVKKEGKRRLSLNGEVSVNKRQHKEIREGDCSVTAVIPQVSSEKVNHLQHHNQSERNNDELPVNPQEKEAAPVAKSDRVVANGSCNGHANKGYEDRVPVKMVVENGDGGNLNPSIVDNHRGEPVDRREGHQSGAELRDDKSEANGCQPMEIESGGSREHSVGNGTNDENPLKATNGSTNLVYKDNLYGVGVPRWDEDEVGEKEVDRLLRETEKANVVKQQDLWDAEYDRGKTKKVRNKSVEELDGRHMMNGKGNGSLKSENPFQAFGNSKVGNGIENGKRAGNGHVSSIGFKGGKYLSQ